MSGDHIQQKQYLASITGDAEFWKFHKTIKDGQCFNEWKLSSNLRDNVFSFDKRTMELNPEKTDRNPLLQKIENEVALATKTIIFTAPTTTQEYYIKILYGIQMYARFGLIKKLNEDNSNITGEDHFDEIFHHLKETSNLLVKPEECYDMLHMVTEVLDIDPKLNGSFKFRQIEVGTITYASDELIVSDNPILYSPNYMFYPLNSRQLFCAWRKDNAVAKQYLDSFKESRHWNMWLCQNAHLFLIAHKDINPAIRVSVKENYDGAFYKFSY